jgi:heat shock protein HslJ
MAIWYKNWIRVTCLFGFINFSTLTSCQQNPSPNTDSVTHQELLGYTKEVKLSGSRWILKSIKGHKLLADPAITLNFSDTKFSGDDGCNYYGAGFFIRSKNRFEWKTNEGGATQMGCPEPRNSQSNIYMNEIYHITNYNIEGSILSLSDDQSKVLLQYKLLPKIQPTWRVNLIEKTWRLNSKMDLENSRPEDFTIKFEENKVSILSFYGTTSCGNYQGSYKAVDDNLNILQYIDIKTGFFNFLCSEKNRMAEKNYIEFLKHIQKYKAGWRSEPMELYADNGKKLEFNWWDRM